MRGIVALLLVACSPEPFDAERKTEARGTLGEEIFRLFHRDFAREDERKARGFEGVHDDFVGAIDHLFPPDELADTQEFLVRQLPLYDDATIPEATQKLGAAVHRLADDREALISLAALGHRIGYVDLSHEEALLRRIAGYSKYRALTRAMIDLALEHDGLDAAGAPDPDESDALTRLQTSLADNLANLELSADAERDVVLMAELMLSEDPRLAERAPGSVQVVARDPRGVAKVAAPTGRVPTPFVDRTPADGLADVDPEGRFVGEDGRPLGLQPFAAGVGRDATGRLLDPQGATVFEYVDLDRTLLAGTLRDSRTLIERGIPMKMVRTFDHVLGDRYEGRYTNDQAMLELMHATGNAMNFNELPDLMALVRILLEEHEATTTWSMLELQAQLDLADRYPNLALQPGSTFFEDLIGWLRKVLAVRGLAEDVIEVMQQPEVLGTPEAMVQLLSHKKARISEADFDNRSIFVEAVDRGQPDRGANQSIGQRLFHLIYDTKGARYTPEFIGVPIGFIFEIDDLAEFYLLSSIGQAEVPALVSTLTGLSQRPTPEELARFINHEQDFGNPRGHEGIDVKDNDGDTLFAASASGMMDALRPLVQTFHTHGQLRLLFELFEILHLHWATPQSDYQPMAGVPRYSKRSGIRSYEPLLIQIFSDTKVMHSAQKLLRETRTVQAPSGRRAHDLLLATARKVMNKDTNLRTRGGRRDVTIDGVRITPLSPFDLVRAALDRLDTRLDRNPERRAEWDEIVDALYDILLEAERTGPEAGQMKNRRALPMAALMLRFMEQRAEAHKQRGDLDDWTTNEWTRLMEDAITSDELPALLDLIYAMDADPEIDAAMRDLRDELLDESRGFADLLATLGDLMGSAQDASLAAGALHFLGKELEPQQLHLHTMLTMAKRSIELDPDEHMLEVARRGLEAGPGGIQIYGLTRAVRQVNRVDPLQTSSPSATDLEAVVRKLGDYLLDDQHGMEKFYKLVANRKAPQ